jgi:PhnB protein
MTFYGKCLGAEPNITPFSAGSPPMPEVPKEVAERILHAELHSGPVVLMACDTQPGTLFRAGTNFSVSLGCESLAEMERLFAALGENGSVNLPLHDAVWGGRLGALTDQFGIQWMLSFR